MSAKGKIGRLPYAVRQQINICMRDGEPDISIIAWLNGLPEVKDALKNARFGGARKTASAITPQNLSEYRANGYQDWLAEQEKVERVKSMAEFSMRLADAAGGDVNSPAVSIAAGKIMEALELASGEDLLAMSETLAKLNKSEADKVRARTDQNRLEVQRGALALEREKFQRTTSELFLKWYGNKKAEEIVNGKGNKDAKIDQIRQLMFGELTDAGT